MCSKAKPENNLTAPKHNLDSYELLQLISLLPCPVVYLSVPDYTIVLVNDAQLRLWGLPQGHICGRQFLELIPPEIMASVQQALEAAVTSATTIMVPQVSFGGYVTHGNTKPFKMDIKPVWNAGQEMLGLLCISEPMPETAQHETETLNNCNRYVQLFENARVSLWEEDYSAVKTEIEQLLATGVSDLDTYFNRNPGELNRLISMVVIKGVNKATLQLHGGTREELLAGLAHFFVADTLPAFLKQLKIIAAGGGPYEHETVIRRKDGRLADVQVLINFPTGPDYSSVPVTLIDITEQKEAEEALRQSEERSRVLAAQLELRVAERTRELEKSQGFLQSVLDTTKNGIISYLPLRNSAGVIEDFLIQFVNDQVTEDLGLIPALITGKTMREVFPQAFEDGSYKYLVRYFETGEENSFDLNFSVNGKTKYFSATVSRQGAGATITVTNITEQKENALQLERINTELQRSNSELQQFAHVASHDLKEPLRKIRTFQSMIEQKHGNTLPAEVNSYLDRIAIAARRMNDMVEGVLQYAKPDTNGTPPEFVPLNKIIDDVATGLELMINEKKAQIQCLQLPWVMGTPILLYQLFYNLVFNALKFSRKDVPPEITISGNEQPDGFVSIAVKDNGIGFAQEHAEKIFRTFTRLYSKDQYEGSGLGLALCRKIAERHGGTISATSSPGEGATFLVRLPGA